MKNSFNFLSFFRKRINQFNKRRNKRIYDHKKRLFSDHSFATKWTSTFSIAVFLGYFFQLISSLNAGTYLFDLINEFTSPNNIAFQAVTKQSKWMISIGITVGTLFLLEFLIRKFAKNGIVGFFPTSNLKKVSYSSKIKSSILLFLTILLALVSIFLSFKGSFGTVKHLSEKPIYIAPSLVNIDSLREVSSVSIQEAKMVAETYLERSTYKGKLDRERSNEYYDLLTRVQTLEDKMEIKIKNAIRKNEELKDKAKQNYQESLLFYEQETEIKGRELGYVNIVTYLLLMVCLWFEIYYNYKTNGGKSMFRQKTRKTRRASQSRKHSNETIEHEGKQYNLSQINRFIRNYKKREATHLKNGNDKAAQHNREKRLYWEKKKTELLNKIRRRKNKEDDNSSS